MIVLDPGHGNGSRRLAVYDPGASYEGMQEADYVLALALDVAAQIQARGAEVKLTRRTTADVAPLGERINRARRWGATRFLSIHCNAAMNPSATGTETLYEKAHAKDFATDVQRVAVHALGLRDRGVKQTEGLAVLEFERPAVLLEVGFLSNLADRQVLRDPVRRLALVVGLADLLTRKDL